jgi:hypothetical protein
MKKGKGRTINAERLPCCVYFWGSWAAEDGFVEEGAIELRFVE